MNRSYYVIDGTRCWKATPAPGTMHLHGNHQWFFDHECNQWAKEWRGWGGLNLSYRIAKPKHKTPEVKS